MEGRGAAAAHLRGFSAISARKSPSLLGRFFQNHFFGKKRIISKNGFEKNDPASWATFSPKSQKIVANARRPLRGRNGILKITLRWVSEASENPWKKGRKSVRIHVKHGWVGLGVMACSKMIQSAPCPGPFLRDKGVSWGAPQGPTAGANCSHHIHSNGCRAFPRGK